MGFQRLVAVMSAVFASREILELLQHLRREVQIEVVIGGQRDGSLIALHLAAGCTRVGEVRGFDRGPSWPSASRRSRGTVNRYVHEGSARYRPARRHYLLHTAAT